MKKLTFSLLFILSLFLSSKAQNCDPFNFPYSGFFFESTGDSFITLNKGTQVSEVLHFRLSPNMVPAYPLEYYHIDSITKLPLGITASLNQNWGHQYQPGEHGCITLTGTAPNASHNDKIGIMGRIKVQGFQEMTGDLQQVFAVLSSSDTVGAEIVIVVKDSVQSNIPQYRITGKVFADVNLNCLASSIDSFVSNIRVLVNDTLVYFTNTNGQYRMDFNSPGVYTIKVDTAGTSLACGVASKQITLTAQSPQSLHNDFALKADTTKRDLSIKFSPFGVWLFGYIGNARIVYNNYAFVAANAILRLKYDSLIRLDTSITAPYNATLHSIDTTARIIEWYISNIPPRSTGRILAQFQLPFPVAPSVPIVNEIWILPDSADRNPDDNYIITDDLVTGSYDPNDKQVSPYGVNRDGKIDLPDSVLTYKVRFQNTGTGPAVNVVIVDTLDSDLNLLSFRPLMSSHPYSTELKGNIVTFTFSNIMLPDSNSNEPESHGFVEYRIKKKTGLGYGTVIENSASIYFDFNDPVKTNTIVSRYELPLSVRETHIAQTVELYPNPTNGVLHIAAGADIEQVYISDISGRVVLQQNVADIAATLNVQELPVGMYFVGVKVSGNMVNKRFIKQ